MPLDPALESALGFVDPTMRSRLPVPNNLPDDAYGNRFSSLPPSTNVDDRRNEIGLRSLLQAWLGIPIEHAFEALKHPMTPYSELTKGLPGGDNKNSQLAEDAGVNAIGGPLLYHKRTISPITDER